MGEKIGVLGGGISGLTFSSLVKNSEVLEKEGGCGGLAKSIYDGEYIFDIGSHIIFSNNEKVLVYMLDLLGENKIKHTRNSKIIFNGIEVKYPFENGLGDLPKEDAYDCLKGYVQAHVDRETKKIGHPSNFKEWMLYRFGEGITNNYLYPYNRKVWDYLPEKMDIFWVDGRVPQPPVEDVIKAALKMKSEGYTHQLNFYYPNKGGYGALIRALEERVGKGRIHTNFEIKKIKKEGRIWVVEGPKEKVYDQIVTTLHIRDFVNMYDGVDEEVIKASKKLRWNSIYIVVIGIKKNKINDIHWAYIPDNEILPNRISFHSNYSPNVAPKNCSTIVAEITYDPNGEKSKLSEREIIERTIEDLKTIKIINNDEIVYTKVVKYPYAYVVYDLEYKKNISIIEKFAKNEGITLLGRFSEFKYYNADKCIESAMEKARLFL